MERPQSIEGIRGYLAEAEGEVAWAKRCVEAIETIERELGPSLLAGDPPAEEMALDVEFESNGAQKTEPRVPALLSDGVIVGAIWEKLPAPNKSSGKAMIVRIDPARGVMFDRQPWRKLRKWVSLSTLIDEWRLVREPVEIYNVSAWVFDQLAEESADAKKLLSSGIGLCYKGRQITKERITAGISSLTKKGYVRRLDDGTSCAVTELGHAELRLRAIIVDLLREIGPLSVSEICRNLRTHFGNTASESVVKRSLNSLECSRLVERYGTSWRASS